MPSPTRRDFLKTALAGLAMGAPVCAAQRESSNGVPTRSLGKTGERVPIVGLGGYHIGVPELTEREAIAIMHEAIDEGMTFFDNCPHYNDSRSEQLMGKALATGGRRQKVFLMTKVCGRNCALANEQLEGSLRRLKTDHVDLWQFHGLRFTEDPELIFDEKNGAYRAALDAQKAGKVRYVGFTSHHDPKLCLAMLEKPFSWTTAQMPLSLIEPHNTRSFQRNLLPKCVERGVGVLAMKVLGGRGAKLVQAFDIDPTTCRHYALSLPVSTMICGISSRKDLHQDLEAARTFKPLTEQRVAELLASTKADAGTDGRLEWYRDAGCFWHRERIGQKL